jgi:hypothetical protein
LDRNFKISYNPHIKFTSVSMHVRSTCHFNRTYFSHAFLIVLIKKIYVSYIFKGYMSFLYVGCIKFPTNRFEKISVQKHINIFLYSIWQTLVSLKKILKKIYFKSHQLLLKKNNYQNVYKTHMWSVFFIYPIVGEYSGFFKFKIEDLFLWLVWIHFSRVEFPYNVCLISLISCFINCLFFVYWDILDIYLAFDLGIFTLTRD